MNRSAAFTAGTFCGSPVPLKIVDMPMRERFKALRLALQSSKVGTEMAVIAVGLTSQRIAIFSGSSYGSRFKTAVLITLKIAVFADTQRQREDGHQREGGLSPQRAKRVFEAGGPIGHGAIVCPVRSIYGRIHGGGRC